MVPYFFFFFYSVLSYFYIPSFSVPGGGIFFLTGVPRIFFFFLSLFVSINPLRLLCFGSSAVGSDRDLVMGVRICGFFFWYDIPYRWCV